MSGIEKIKHKIRQIDVLKKSISNIVKEVLMSEEAYISELVRKQLQSGIKGDGTDMPNYVPNSKQPSAPGKITLFDTGDFYAGIEPLFADTNFSLTDIDDKTGFLVAKYGEILGLNKESLQVLYDRVRPKIKNRILQVLA